MRASLTDNTARRIVIPDGFIHGFFGSWRELNGLKRVRVLVEGRVQGVCFRMYTRETARGLGVNGCVRNLPDGRVEIVAEGEDDDVDALVRWASAGPSHARVSRVMVTEMECTGDRHDFRIEH
jgi:acylphosphatase